MKSSFVLFSSGIILAIQVLGTVGLEEKPRFQPELDSIDVDSYLKNERRVRQQFKCLLNDNAPCDAIGRWLKPRLGRAFLGECVLCTPRQVENLEKINAFMEAYYPNEFRQIISKYIQKLGIQLPAAETQKESSSAADSKPPEIEKRQQK